MLKDVFKNLALVINRARLGRAILIRRSLAGITTGLMKGLMKALMIGPMLAFTVMMALAVTGVARAEIITPSEYVIIMDHESGEVLYEKNADVPMKPASMAKLMTTYIAFKQLAEGSLKMEDKLIVSNKAYRKGGSRMFLELNSQVTIEELLRGIIVQSGNDAAIVVAEGLAGTEEAFAEVMTIQAKKLGMMNTVFGNATGWPDDVTTTTARDLAILSQALIRNFPELYQIYAEKSYEYNGIKQNNRNPLIYNMDGADGLKTGHTVESGYGLAGSAMIDGQRIIMVMNGLSSAAERKSESMRLLNLVFRTFKRYEILKEGEIVGAAPVYLGVEDKVSLVPAQALSRVLTRAAYEGMTMRKDWPNPVNAPISKGQEIGAVVVMIDGAETRIPLVAAQDVAQLPFYLRIGAFFKYLIFGSEAVAPQ